jgi:hypothetical protein
VAVRLRDVRGVGRERGEAISGEVHRRTFGRIVNELIQSGVVSSELSGIFVGSLEEFSLTLKPPHGRG